MAEAPQPPPTTTLENLPMDAKLSILLFIPCEADRVALSRVCTAWRGVISGGVEANAELPSPPPRPRPLPWLLLPVPDPYASVSDFVCVLSGCRVHHQLTITPSGGRCFGSHDGGWLFLHFAVTGLHEVLNVRNNRAHMLPSMVARYDEFFFWPVHNMVILAAALSSSPEDDASCAAVFIGASWPEPCQGGGLSVQWPRTRRCAAYWRKGWGWACEIAPHLRAEDVTYHAGSFYLLLAHGNNIYVCTPIEGDSWIQKEERRVCPGAHLHWHQQYQRFRACYLVVSSSNELLLVLRFVLPPARGRSMTTSEFRVFRATERRQEVPDADADDFPVAQYPWAWIELDTLGDRMLFVGHGCSRAYDASQYPGFKGGVYFLDDGKFPEEAVLIRERHIRSYLCYDNGKWSEGRVHRCFPTPPPSYRSAPAWLLP